MTMPTHPIDFQRRRDEMRHMLRDLLGGLLSCRAWTLTELLQAGYSIREVDWAIRDLLTAGCAVTVSETNVIERTDLPTAA